MISNTKASQTSLVRTGLGKETALFIASVVGAATLFRNVRRRRGNRRRQLLARQSAQARCISLEKYCPFAHSYSFDDFAADPQNLVFF